MDIKRFKECRESDDYKKLGMDSNIILYKNSFGSTKDSLEWGVWGGRDVWDDLLETEQKEYPELDIKRMKVSDILKQDSTEYSYVKEYVLKELN